MKEKMREYARLLIEVGLSARKGQTLLISATTECAPFVRLCAAAAYEAGCRDVEVFWSDDVLLRQRYLYGEDSLFDHESAWKKHLFNDAAAADGIFLSVDARNPEMLNGVELGRIKRQHVAGYREMSFYHDSIMQNRVPWCVSSVPAPGWAKKVFPELPEREAMGMLWDAIFASVRVTGDGRAVGLWHEHLEKLEKRRKILNDMRLVGLHYTNSRGTDLHIGLPAGHRWVAGQLRSERGQLFVPNMPTEEIFTAPQRDNVNGVVVAGLPAVIDGSIIDKFRLTVKNGRVVEAYAEKGQENLRAVLATGENTAYFGEVALVPYDSPISRQGIRFYNSLFDENAGCHLSLGSAYSNCVEGGEQMTREELMAHGLNQSVLHADLMIGTPDLDITGTLPDGREVPIFKNGKFAI